MVTHHLAARLEDLPTKPLKRVRSINALDVVCVLACLAFLAVAFVVGSMAEPVHADKPADQAFYLKGTGIEGTTQ